MDALRFLEACEYAVGRSYDRDTVGILSEKTLHATLKRYFEPDENYHECKVGAYYADVCRDDRITEIQTRSLDRLRGKLSAFLQNYHVTVVYPIPAQKYLIWMDPATGDLAERRRVSKKGSFYDAGRELWYISEFLGHPNLTVRLLLIDMDEYRLQNGRGADKKRGAERYDRIPTALRDELILHSASSYEALFPDKLTEPFTAKEFRRAVKGGPRTSPALLQVLVRMGIVERAGKSGRAYLYQKVQK